MRKKATPNYTQDVINKRNEILTWLYCNSEIDKKIAGIMYRHNIPSTFTPDLKQQSFEELLKFDAKTLIDAYNDNKNRVIAIWLRITLRRCIYYQNQGKQFSYIPQQLTFSAISNNNTEVNITDTYNEDATDVVIGDDNNLFESIFPDTPDFEKIKYAINLLDIQELNILNTFLKTNKIRPKQLTKLTESIKKNLN